MLIKKKRSRKATITTLVCSIAIVFIWWNPQSFFDPARTVLLTIIKPIQKISFVTTQRIKNITSAISDIGEIKKENNALKEEIATLKTKDTEARLLKEENAKLRGELGLEEKKDVNTMAVEVIGADPQSQGDWIMIDKGRNKDIQKGQIVTSRNGAYIGRVEEVFPRSARVMLVTNTQSAVGGMIAGKKTEGIVKGQYGLGIKFDLVLQSEQIEKGDVIVTSGINDGIPKGLIIGTVQDIEQSEDALFLSANIIPQIESSQMHIVYIVNNSKE